MDNKTTHFKYVCRGCLKEHLEPVLKDAENTPHPSCCGSRRNMAYKGAVSIPAETPEA